MIKKQKFSLIWMIVLIYVYCSLYSTQFSQTVITFFSLFMVIAYQLITKNKITIKKKILIYACILSLLILISCVVNKWLNLYTISPIFHITIAILIVSSFENENTFFEIFIKAIKIFAILSLIIYSLMFIMPNLIRLFPYIGDNWWYGNNKVNLINTFISIAPINANYKRNYGIFCEPGIFALYLNLALFFMLFKLKKFDLNTFIIIIITLSTTFSTNGYLSLVLIMIAFLLRKGGKLPYKYKKDILIFICVLLVILFIFFKNNPQNWNFLVSKIFEKAGDSKTGSGTERYNAIKYAWNGFLSNPIFGISTGRSFEFFNGNIATFTPLQWFTNYGIIYGIFCCINFALFAINKGDGILSNLFKVLALFSLIISQNMTQNIFILSIIFYQCIKKMKGNQNDNSNNSNI